MAIRNGADEVRKSIAERIRDDFDFTNVNGLSELPPITQNPTRQTQEPYVYIYSVSENEIDVTKETVPIEYTVNVEICIRYNSYRGGQRQANQILDEVVSAVRGVGSADYPSVTGFDIYRIKFGNIKHLKFNEEGANYYKVICPFFISACQATPGALQQPSQAIEFVYADWMFIPGANRHIERYDNGTITPSTTYPSGNNGYNFIDANYSISSGAGGTLVGGVYTLPSAVSVVSLDSTLRYANEDDDTIVTSLQATTTFDRIDSIRYGSLPAEAGMTPNLTDNTASTYGLRLLSNWNIEFGTVTPHLETITITGGAGEYLYIIVDQNVTLSQIRNSLGQNNIGSFTVTTVGDYKIYLLTDPLVFDDSSFDFTLISS